MELVHQRFDVDGVPVLLVTPADGPRGPLALWLSHFGGSKEQCLPMLRALAGTGLAAVSFDAVEHGERGAGHPMALMQRVGSDPRLLWTLLGETALDAPKVVDRALAETGADGVVAGGVSFGGSVSVAVAGLDERVQRVAAAVATPDWSRAASVRPDPAGAPHALRERLEPMTNLERFRRGVPIAFECAGADDLVPPDMAEDFRLRLTALDPEAGALVRVRIHPGLDHFQGAADPGILGACAQFLVAGD
jgi:dienelactone hydrolase